MKKTILTLVAILVTINAMAWTPSLKYAKWVPMFGLDKVWAFDSGSEDKKGAPLYGCDTVAFPGTICWAMMSWDERRANADDYNMRWADVYLCDPGDTSNNIKLCRVVPWGVSDDNGWELKSLTQYNGATYLAKEVFRDNYEDGSGFLFFVTFYNDAVRQFITNLHSQGKQVAVRFRTEWDDGSWHIYDETSTLDAYDGNFLVGPPQPWVRNVEWEVNNGETTVAFNLDNVSYSDSYSVYVQADSGRCETVNMLSSSRKHYALDDISQYKDRIQGGYRIPMNLYSERSYSFSLLYYKDQSMSDRTTGYTRSDLSPFQTPVMVNPGELRINDLYNGSVSVAWTVPSPSTADYDTSAFILERSTSENFTANHVSYRIPYSARQTEYSLRDSFTMRDMGSDVTFYYRIHRANSVVAELGTTETAEICTDYADLESLEASIDTATRKVCLSWDYTLGIINSELTLHVTSAQLRQPVNIPVTPELRSYCGITIPECVQTQFTMQQYTRSGSRGKVQVSNSVCLQQQNSAVIDTLIASAGYYNNRVELSWKANATYHTFSSFVLSRMAYGDTAMTQIADVPYTQGTLNYSFTDNTCVPGVYYLYLVQGISTCDTQTVRVAPLYAIGFAQPTGFVSGQVLYDGNQASPNVAIMASGNGHYRGKSLSFVASRKPILEIPTRFVSSMLGATEGTVEFFLRLNDTNESNTILSYKDQLALKTQSGQLVLQIKDGAGTTHTVTYDSLKNDGRFNHIAITYGTASGNRTCTLYINGVSVGSVTYSAGTSSHGIIEDVTGKIYFGSNQGTSGFMNGNIDEIRFWEIARTEAQVRQTSDTYLNGAESGLTGYYRCDEDVYKVLFDISKTGNYFNGRHVYINGIPFDTLQVPTREQLCFKTYTDENGHYFFNNIPYSDDGTQYTITPMLNVHEFSPVSRPLYFHSTSLVHNAVDFTDVSSFSVSGTVYYHNTNYPAAGCQFYVDGTSPCMKSGNLITSDASGNFTIEVPIGEHYITVQNGNHTFANGGRYPATGLHEFMAPMQNLTFYDSTFVLVTGRVSGGSDEEEKPHGFGQGKATIGQAKIVISPVGAIYDLNTDTANARTFVMPADSMQVGTCNSVATAGRAVANYAKYITIYTDSATGEFNMMVPPLNYKVNSVNIVHNDGNIDFGSSMPSLDLTQQDVNIVTTDSFTVDSVNWYYFKYSMALDMIYNSYPQMVLRQDGQTNSAIGQEKYYYASESGGVVFRDTIPLYTVTPDSIRYRFGHPCFSQGDVHTWWLTVTEDYVNYDNRQHPDTTRQPFRYGIVTVENNFGTQIKNKYSLMDTVITVSGSKMVSVSGNEMLLDSSGKTYYSFSVSDPVVFSPYTATAQVTFQDADRTRDYDWNGNKDLECIVFGAKMRGTNMVTKGPDEVFYVLRDPPGADSYATWAQGETVTKTSIWKRGVQREANADLGLNVSADLDIVLAPFGWGVKTSLFTTEQYVGPYLKYEGSTLYYDFDSWEFVNEQTVSTSNDHTMVGSKADVYIGKAQNYLYGEADQIALQRDTAGNYSVGKRNAISMSSELTTQFQYSQYYIETYLLPNLKTVRNSLLTTVTEEEYNEDYPNYTPNTIYITTLDSTNTHFGEEDTYLMIPPQDTTRILFVDTIASINEQMDEWIEIMADNEKAKTIVHHSNTAFNQSNWERVVYGEAHTEGLFTAVNAPSTAEADNVLDSIANQYTGGWLIGNYSVGAGAPFSQSQTRSYSSISNGKIESNQLAVGLKRSTLLAIGPIGAKIEFNGGIGGLFYSEETENEQETTTVSYNVLMDSYEALSFDVYQAPDGYGPIFCTRAGQTFCPYEGAETTKYYQPGSNLHTATVPMATPSISATNNSVVNVPVGQSAYFNITLGNAAATSTQMEFLLCEDAATNPNGAVIKMDGMPVTYNGIMVALAGGASTNKVIEIRQTRPDILNYDSIRLIFKTNCYKFDADTIYLTAHFVPTCSDINLSVDKTTLNNTTDTTVHFTISGFSPDFINFQGIQLQYQRQGDVNWTILQTWNAASLQGVATLHHNLKLTLPDYPDGVYQFRAVTLCQWGAETVNNESDIIPITVDLVAPAALGLPYPLDGIYNSVSQVYVDFSEPIQTGRVLQSDVTVEGVLNSHPIDHSISLDLENNSAYSSATYLLDSVPFALEMWIKYTEPGTLFTYAATQNNGVVLSIDANNKLVATINGQSFVSDSVFMPDKWCYLLVETTHASSPQQGMFTLNATYSYGDIVVPLFTNVTVPVVSARGNVIFGGNGLKAKMHDVSLWNTTRTWATALAERNQSKSPYTPNLISLWRMDEGKGTKAADCIRHRDLVLSADAWAYNYTNYALHIPAHSTASVDISACPIPEGQNWMFEFWFRANGNAHLFHLSNDSIRVGINNGNLTINTSSFPIRDYTDSTWHHLAIIYKNTTTPIIAVDGVQVSTYLLTSIAPFNSSPVIFGADTSYMANTNDIDIDEIRLWKVNTTLDVARLYRNVCMRGNEPGLQAYYPMEHTILDAYNQNVTLFTTLDKTATDTLTAKRISWGGDGACSVSTSSPALVESRPTEYVAHTFTPSENRVVINITETDARIEGCTLEFTVKSVVDQNGNYSQPIKWSAYVNRNQLLWDEDVISIVKDELVDTTFNLVIINNGSQTKSWSIDNVPTWMSLSESSGYIQPLQRETLTCTINSSLGRGEDEYTLYLSSDDNIDRPLYLNTKVYANRPSWTVDPTKYSSSMNLITCAEINGVLADDPEDMIGAFIGTELVGVAHLQLFPAYGRYLAMMTIYCGSDSKNRNVTFRYWDASNGVVYNNISIHTLSSQNTDSIVNPLVYNAETIYGDIENPYLLRMGTEVEQSNDMSKGWNWISMNVVPTIATVEDVWRQYLSYVDLLKSQSDFVMTDTVNGRMIGTLDTMDCYKGYRLKANRKFTAKITGTPMPANSTFTIAPNRWTWIGYIPQAALPVNAALSNINPSIGDIIKSQREFATWDGSMWVGTLEVMEPGKGYSYKNKSSSPILFSYPDYSAFSYLPVETERAPSAGMYAESHFTPIDPGLYQGNMTMTAIVKLNGEEIEDAEVAVFAGDECRAVSEYVYGFYFLTIPGEESVDMTIKVVYNDSIYSVKEGFTYESDQILGDIYDPYVIDLSGENTAVVSVEADAEGDRVEKVLINNEVFIIRNGVYYDMTGRRREKPQP